MAVVKYRAGIEVAVAVRFNACGFSGCWIKDAEEGHLAAHLVSIFT